MNLYCIYDSNVRCTPLSEAACEDHKPCEIAKEKQEAWAYNSLFSINSPLSARRKNQIVKWYLSLPEDMRNLVDDLRFEKHTLEG